MAACCKQNQPLRVPVCVRWNDPEILVEKQQVNAFAVKAGTCRSRVGLCPSSVNAVTNSVISREPDGLIDRTAGR